jgi:acyl-CoA reductase-like NAD-dependent aldehyde dehydrogenase
MSRLNVRKTYKLYVGGAFVRSESGRYDRALGADDEHVANVPRASRKDVRDAMAAARKAAGPWAARTAYNRGQILYRAAEALESRGEEVIGRSGGDGAVASEAVAERGADGAAAGQAARATRLGPADELNAAVDVLVHYAGWTDKIAAVLGGVNPVAAPFLSFSLPEPTGVVGVIAPDEPPLLGLVAEIAPALAAGNTVVVVVSERWPLPALDLAEVLGVSDLPGGVVNLLSGRRSELAPALGAHRDLNAIVDAAGDGELSADLDRLAAETVKRARHGAPATTYDAATADALARLEAVTEIKTAWHPVGA